jgi:hypothetical protein
MKQLLMVFVLTLIAPSLALGQSDPKLSKKGESCTRSADCEGELRCVRNMCVAPTKVTQQIAEKKPADWSNFKFETYTDYSTKLTWQATPLPKQVTWQEAKDFCEATTSGGHTDWRLPTISELRTLMDGCPYTATNGACKVTDSCTNTSCWNQQICMKCDIERRWGKCKWTKKMGKPCSLTWSSKIIGNYQKQAWAVDFSVGNIRGWKRTGTTHVRCVRKK